MNIKKLLKKLTKKITAVILALLVVGGPLVYLVVLNSKSTSAAWYSENWAYRQKIEVTNSSGSAQTNFQVSFTIDTQTLITAKKMQSNCADVRIIDLYGKSYPYWIEPTSCNTTTTKIWTKIPSLPANNITLYMYYGNPAASAPANTTVSDVFIREISNVQGAWKMDEAAWTVNCTTTSVVDSSGNSNNGKACPNSTGPSGGATGKFNNGGGFDGNNDYVNIPDNASLEFTAGLGNDLPFSISSWIKLTEFNSTHVIISKYYQTHATEWGMLYSGSNIYFSIYTSNEGAYLSRSAPFTSANYNNTWVHVLTTYDGSKTSAGIKIYINGTQSDNADLNAGSYTGMSDTSTPVLIGARFDVNNNIALPFQGSVDEVRVYNKALSSAEISDLYGTGGDRLGYVTTNYANKELVIQYNSSISAANPSTEEKSPAAVAYWKFDEGQGTSANDSTSTGATGTLAGTTKPAWQTENLCISGKCLYFDGSTSNITVANAIANIQTISLWVKPNAVTTSALIDLDGGTHKVTVSSGTISTSGFTNSTIYVNGVQTTTLTANSWSLVTITTTDTGVNSTSSQTIGKSSTTLFQGFMDDVKMYNFTKTAAQIKQDYVSGLANSGTKQGVSAALGANPEKFLSEGLIGYWKTDESSGNAADSSGNSLTLTNNSSMAYAAGMFGNGVRCDGTADYLNTATAINGIQTVSFWAKTAAAANNYFVNLINSSAYITIDSSGVVSATGFTSPSIYVNGVLNGTVSAATWSLVTVTTGTGINANAFAVGLTNDGSNHFCTNTSLIDEVRLYNRSLSPSEIRQLADWAPGPIGYWKMDDNVSGNAQTLIDSSNNSNNFTTNNGANGTGMSCTITGKYRKGCQFDGVDDFVTKASPGFLSNTQGSVSLWARLANNTQYSSIWGAARDVTSNSEVRLDYRGDSNKELQLTVVQNGSVLFSGYTTANAITDTNWHYLTVTSNGSTLKLYVDGVEKPPDQTVSGTNSGQWFSSATSANNFTVGILKRATPVVPFKGDVDEVMVYDYGLTAKQVVQNMNAGHAAPTTPLAYWKFDEGYGTGVAGAHNSGNAGSALDGTLSGSTVPSWTNSGKLGKALSFNGTSAYIAMPSDTAALKITGDLTLSAWINLTNTSSQHDIICKYTGTASTSAYCLYTNTSGQLVMSVVNSTGPAIVTTTETSTTLSASTWYHVAGVLNTTLGQVNLYINGALVKQNTTSIPAALQNPATILDIGAENAGSNLFNGTIDEAKVYNYALTADEVKTEYNRGSSMVLGALSDNSTYQIQAANQEYCVPGDTTSCAAPVGRWDFEEGTGTSVNDTSGTGNTGTWNGTGSHWAQGKIGKAGKFNGSDDYIALTSALNMANTMTITGWFYTNDITKRQTLLALHSGDGTTGNIEVGTSFGASSGSVGMIQYGNTYAAITPSGLYNNGAWVHFAYTINGSATAQQFYINGSPVTTTTNNVTFSDTSSVGVIGRRGAGSQVFSGAVDDLRVYNYARSAAQIAWDYNRGKPMGWWKMDECQGTVIHDSSGNNYNGTWSAGTTYTQAGTCTDGNAASAWYGGRAGKYNYSLDFDGTASNKVTIGTAINGVQSVSFWVKPTTSTDSFMDLDGGTHYITSSSGTVSATGFSSPTIYVNGISGGTITGGAWNHVVVTTGTSFNTTTGFTLGYKSAATADYLTGQLDDVRVYNYALTGTQVKTVYNNGAVNFGPNTGSP